MGLKVIEMRWNIHRGISTNGKILILVKKLDKYVPLVINWDWIKFNKHLFPFYSGFIKCKSRLICAPKILTYSHSKGKYYLRETLTFDG